MPASFIPAPEHRHAVMTDADFFRGTAAFLLAKVLGDLRCWAESPHPESLPDGWKHAYQQDLRQKVDAAKQQFAGDSEACRRLQQIADDARDLISAMGSSFRISGTPAAEWPTWYQTTFGRVHEGELWLRDLAGELLAKDEDEVRERQRRMQDDSERRERQKRMLEIREDSMAENAVVEAVANRDVGELSAAATAVPASPCTVSAVGSGDRTEVNAATLARFCGLPTSKTIRNVLKDCVPSRMDERGRLWWEYGQVFATLCQWCLGHRVKRFRTVRWPDRADALSTRKKTKPESSKK
jgi:hypothetical protein